MGQRFPASSMPLAHARESYWTYWWNSPARPIPTWAETWETGLRNQLSQLSIDPPIVCNTMATGGPNGRPLQ